MAKNDLVSFERVHQLFSYEAETGILRWRTRTPDMFENGIRSPEQRCGMWNSKFAESEAGNFTGWNIQIELPEGFTVLAHRVIWLMVHGVWPKDQIDHINGNPADNRFANLREATQSQNQQNRLDKSPHVGATWNRQMKKWKVRISVGGKQKWIGYFDTAEEGHQAYLDAKKEFHLFNPVPRRAA